METASRWNVPCTETICVLTNNYIRPPHKDMAA